ncbi:MAG TPA: LD-carboxypeptidase [Ideonella sp.]|uniref:LD-carboxypeptidase n=1 Tax=Ideonella sp. TaxID=1929293 RepID=UPI002C16AE9E|nr:LD-carboxypeptidase [Ideonella sp.]HSI51173.1 LD-carboxypeptidase [Ideonella sp.]
MSAAKKKTQHADHGADHAHGHDHDHAHHHEHTPPSTLTIYSPAGVVLKSAAVKLAAKRLKGMGYAVTVDTSALAKHQRFAGDDEFRLATLHRIAEQAPSVALATRGGYGMTRLLDRLDWALLAKAAEQGTRWVGYSDLTALQMGLLAHTGTASWCGPMATDDFGRDELDEVTPDCFNEAMSGELEAVGFRTEAGFDGLAEKGVLWGGNLTVLCSLLGTQHWPKVKGGILFLEDVAEHPYRVERMLLQLHQAGVLAAQKAVVLGAFSDWRKSPMDRGYNLKTVVAYLREVSKTPILTGLPFGHVPTKVTMPMGRKVQLLVQARDVLIGWN